MEELLDMIVTDESPSQISDKIKDLLFAKSAERVDAFRPVAANSLFGNDEVEIEDQYGEEE
jgi:hypothetical protein